MKVFPFQIPKPDSAALTYQEDEGEIFYDKYHQHSEIQISHIVSGEGTMIVGDSISPYKSGDIIVIGSGLPHVLRSDETFGGSSFMQSLFFTRESFGESFFMLEDLKSIRSFFRKAENGFKPLNNLNNLRAHFDSFHSATQLDRVICLLKILNLLSRSKYQSLSGFVPKSISSHDDGSRISEVMSYSMERYSEPISLSEISGVASMTKNAFCKYFKRRTNKTYIQFLNELRVEQACKMLLDRPELNIAEIAERCGFQNMSNFNRQFRAIKKMTPSEIQKIS